MGRTESKISFPGLGIEEFTVDSVAFKIFGMPIPWYAIIITTGIIVAVFYVWRQFLKKGLSTDDLLDFALFVVPFGIVGARLFYVLFKLDTYIVTNQGSFFANLGKSLLKIVSVWNGGLAIYGAIIAGGITACLVARHKKISIFKILDCLAPAVMLAQSIGRWGNFMNGEAFGYETDIFCRMGLLNKWTGGSYVEVHPTFFYESLWNLIGFLIIYFVFVRIEKNVKFDGQIFYQYLSWYGFGRMLIEGLRSDSLWLIQDVIRISQLIGLLAFLVGVIMITDNLLKQRKAKNNG